jgi:hypothetical protein
VAVGAATTSTSTTITISYATRILAEVIATTSEEIAEVIPTGDITRNIAAAPRIVIELPRTDSAAQHVEIPFQTAKVAPGSKLVGKGAIWPAIAVGAEVLGLEALATEPVGEEGTG